MLGKVVKISPKTAKVQVVRLVWVPKYRRFMKIIKNHLAHTERILKIGEEVELVSCRKLSPHKHYKIL